MRVEIVVIVVRDECPPNEGYATCSISIEGLAAMPKDLQKVALHDGFVEAYKKLTGKDWK